MAPAPHPGDAPPGASARARVDTDPAAPAEPLASARTQRLALVVVVVLAFLAAAWIASALWAGLLLGLLTAFTLEPAHRLLLRRWPRRRGLAAGVSILLSGLACAAFLGVFAALATSELLEGVQALRQLLRGFPPATALGPRTQRSLEALGVTPEMIAARIAHVADRATEVVYGAVGATLGSTYAVIGGCLIAFVTAYYTLKDQRPIERRLLEILPLHPRTTRELVDEFRKVGRGTLVGSLLTGLVQGGLASAGYAIAGVPRALLLGLLTAVASFFPIVGTLLVWVPVGVVLIVTGHVAAGVFEIAWGVLVTTTLVDYVLRPRIVGRESRSHPLLLLIGVIGGVEVLGGVGVIAGPIIMAFFASVLRIYRRELIGPHEEDDL